MSDPLSTFGFSTPDIDELFSPASIVDQMMQFEAALASSLADTGLVPEGDAAQIVQACVKPLPDPNGVLATTWLSGTPVISLVESIRERLTDESAARWVHFGATSQDVIDTAYMVLASRALAVLEGSLMRLAAGMRFLVEEHRRQPQIGRTFLQHAESATFGMRVAVGWLNPTLTHLEAMRATAAALPVQLGGPVGDLAAYGDKGTDVVEALAKRLGLAAPLVSWHTDRSVVARVVTVVERSAAALAKVATDVALLAQTDTAELTVRGGGSSSMPAKRNPIDPIRVLATYEICRGAARMVTDSKPHELDRGLGSWHAEWVALPTVFRAAAAALEASESMIEFIDIDRGAMQARAEEHPHEVDERQIGRVLTRFEEILG